MVWFTLGHSGQRTFVKCAEALWNNKAGGVVRLKSPAFLIYYKERTLCEMCVSLRQACNKSMPCALDCVVEDVYCVTEFS